MKTLTSLLERLNLDPEVLEACARNAEALGLPLERALYEAERINENQYLETAAARHAMPCELRLAALMDKEGSGWATDAERVCKVPLPWLRKQKVVPVRDKDGKLALAICHPSGWLLAQELGMLLGERLERPVLAREDDITDIINRIFGESTRSEGSVSDVLGDSVNAIDEFNEDAVEDLLEDSSEAPFIRLVNMILAQAVRAGASDIHIEPYRDVSRVRFRLDGVLYERHTLNKAPHAAVVSRIKVMAKLNIAEKRLPQDGRIGYDRDGEKFDVRVSTLPTIYGEKVVLRLLTRRVELLELRNLGFSARQYEDYCRAIARPFGMVLICGPTGSGKSTTLYATLRRLNALTDNILTIEDPIEYTLEGVNQVQLKEEIGLTFTAALRTFLRQDPDIIMLGEIRDGATAEMAVRSSLTGHLLFSTIHTNTAWGAVARLSDMGVHPYLVADTLVMTVAQRLVRLLCPHCKREAEASDEVRRLLCGAAPERICEPVGCERCFYTGYAGRRAVYEVIPMDDELAAAVRSGRTDVAPLLAERGIPSLRDAVVDLFRRGQTSLDEVIPLLNY